MMGANPTTVYSGISQIPLSPGDIDQKLAENETLLQEWKAVFIRTDTTFVSSADAITHTQLRKKINENLALLASHLKTFFARTVSMMLIVLCVYAHIYIRIMYACTVLLYCILFY